MENSAAFPSESVPSSLVSSGIRPLDGIRVIDMGLFTAGPLAGRILSDLGADVVKVEPPDGDPTRRIGGHIAGGSSYLFGANNAGKRSIALDLREADDRVELYKLIKVADVLLANFTADSMQQRGIGPDDCRDLNPQLIYCLVSGYGLTGPYSRERAMDMCTQARSGMMAATGPADGFLPTKVGISVIDDLAATTAAAAIVSALAERDRSNLGQLVDVALMDSGAWATQYRWPSANVPGLSGGLGNADPVTGLDDIYPTTDGHVAVSVRHGSDVDALEHLLNIVPDAVLRDAVALHDELQLWIESRSTESAVKDLRDAGIPAVALANVVDVATGEQASARKMFGSSNGALPVVSSPISLDGVRLMATTDAPRCGENQQSVREDWLGQ